jgi:hypothetical protein
MQETLERTKELQETKKIVYKRLLNHLLEIQKKKTLKDYFFEIFQKSQKYNQKNN